MTFITPANAEKVSALSTNQKNTVRQSFGILDNPTQPDRTYIVFDAVSGNNDLHLIIGASSSYSIIKGDGSLAILYTDTGGTKTLSYDVAGRYLITIDGDFNGIDTNAKTQIEKDKYISVIGGSNYLPTTLTINAFQDCTKLEFFEVPTLTILAANVFDGCVLLESMYLPNIADIGNNAFDGCVGLKYLEIKALSVFGTDAFNGVILTDALVLGNDTSSPFRDEYSVANGQFKENGRILRAGQSSVFLRVGSITTDSITLNNIPLGKGVIQKKSFTYSGVTDIQNDTISYIATNLLVAITPFSASSKLIVAANIPLSMDSNQLGALVRIEYKIGAGAWTFLQKASEASTSAINRSSGQYSQSVFCMSELNSPGLSNEVQFRITFRAEVASFFATASASGGTQMITVEEVI